MTFCASNTHTHTLTFELRDLDKTGETTLPILSCKARSLRVHKLHLSGGRGSH